MSKKSKPIAELSDDELRSQRKTMRALIGVIAAVALIYVVLAIVLIAAGKPAYKMLLMSVPIIVMGASSTPLFVRLAALQTELKRRGLN